MTTTIRMPDCFYEWRQTIGGGFVRDVMPYEDATAYVLDDDGQMGVEYSDGHVDWLDEYPTKFDVEEEGDEETANCPLCGRGFEASHAGCNEARRLGVD